MRQHSPTLDVFRAISIILVLITHFTGNFFVTGFGFLDQILRSIASLGSFGVTGFFLLSSYLLTRILLDEYALKANKIWSRYWIRRILRIWPLYLAVLAIFAVLLGGGLTSAPFLVTFTYNWVSWVQPTTPFLAHLWSVCVEEQLYILIPILASLRLKRRVPILIALSSVALLSRFLTPIFFPYPAVWNFTTSHLDVFSLGVLLASLDAAGSEKWLSFRSKFGIRKYSFLWFSLGVIVLMFSVIIWPSAVFESIYSSVSYAVVAILFGFFFLILTESQIGAKFKFMHWIGQRSYGIYLFHWPIVLLGIEIATNQGFPLPLVGLISLISSLILAEFSYRFFESKILSLKKRFTIFRLA